MLKIEDIDPQELYPLLDDVLKLMGISKSGIESADHNQKITLIKEPINNASYKSNNRITGIMGSEIIRFANRPDPKRGYTKAEVFAAIPGLTEDILNESWAQYKSRFTSIFTGYFVSKLYHQVTMNSR